MQIFFVASSICMNEYDRAQIFFKGYSTYLPSPGEISCREHSESSRAGVLVSWSSGSLRRRLHHLALFPLSLLSSRTTAHICGMRVGRTGGGLGCLRPANPGILVCRGAGALWDRGAKLGPM